MRVAKPICRKLLDSVIQDSRVSLGLTIYLMRGMILFVYNMILQMFPMHTTQINKHSWMTPADGRDECNVLVSHNPIKNNYTEIS